VRGQLLGGDDGLAKGHVREAALERLEGGGEIDLVTLEDGGRLHPVRLPRVRVQLHVEILPRP